MARACRARATGRGALVLLEQQTASSSATLDFTSWQSSSYDYSIEFLHVLPASSGQEFGSASQRTGGQHGTQPRATTTRTVPGHRARRGIVITSEGAPHTSGWHTTSARRLPGLAVCGSVRFYPTGSLQRWFLGDVRYLPPVLIASYVLLPGTMRPIHLTDSGCSSGSGNIASGDDPHLSGLAEQTA